MVWSNWKGALVVLVAWVGLAWSQNGPQRLTPTPEGITERLMTVHENGRAVRCRVVATWRLPEGATAYQLQALDTGELLTIVEDGPGHEVNGKSGLAKAIPMRIFHWGRRRTAPPGAPIPPPEIITASGITIVQGAGCDSGCDLPGQGSSTRVVSGGNPGAFQEKILWWENKNGQPSQVIATNGQNPFAGQVIQASGKPLPIGPGGPSMPVIVDSPSDQGNYRIVPVGGTTTGPGGPVPVGNSMPPVIVEGPSMGTTPPRGRPIQGGAPSTTVGAPSTTGMGGQPPPLPPGTILQDGSRVINAGMTVPGMVHPGTLIPGTVPPGSVGPGMIVDSSGMVVGQGPPSPNKAIGERVQNLINPKVNRPSEPTPAMVQEPGSLPGQLPKTTPWPGSQVNKQGQTELPPTTPWKNQAAPPANAWELPKNTKPGAWPPPMGNSTTSNPSLAQKRALPLAMPWSNKKPTQTAQASGKTNDRTPFSTASNQGKVASEKTPGKGEDKNWRDSWDKSPVGKTADTKSPIQQVGVKPGTNNEGVMPAVGGGHERIKGSEDVLLNPDKFDPTTKKNPPRGMDNGFADNKPLVGAMPVSATPAAAPAATGVAQAGNPAGLGDRWPMGAQSVLASRSGIQQPVVYVPVPVTTVPEPVRPPAPPEPNIPQAPQPNAWLNAFSPPPAPQNPQGKGPQAMMQTPNGPMPVNPNMNQFNPQATAMFQIPRQYAGPQAPNPFGQAQPHMGMQMPTQQQIAWQQQQLALQQQQWLAMQHQAMQQAALQQQAMQQQMPIQQTGYAMPAQNPQQAFPAMDRHGANGKAGLSNVGQLVTVLRESPYPAQREWAANTLANYDWRSQPEVVPALLQSAKSDPAGSVRAGSVFTLARLNAGTEQVTSTLATLRGDADPSVRQQVEQALARFGAR